MIFYLYIKISYCGSHLLHKLLLHKRLFLQYHVISVAALSLNYNKVNKNMAITIEKVYIAIFKIKKKLRYVTKANVNFLVGRYLSAQSGMEWK